MWSGDLRVIEWNELMFIYSCRILLIKVNSILGNVTLG